MTGSTLGRSFLGLILAGFCFAGNAVDKLSKDLKVSSASTSVDVIVQFRNGGTETELNKVRQKGGIQKKNFRNLKAASFSLPASELASLATDPDVEFISKDRPVASALDKATATIGADIAWRFGLAGNNMSVALIDSGIQPVDDLKSDLKGSRIVYSESFIDGVKSTRDEYGHGTHVAGVLAGNGASSTGKDFKVT